jgi:hypothetical protein
MARIAALDTAEQERVRWLEGHLIELETGRHPERPPRDAYDPDLHDTERRERAKLAEFEAAGRPMTRCHLQRLRRAYRDDGLLGLADKRKLREVAPGSETDPRVIEAIEKMLAEPRGRSTNRPLGDVHRTGAQARHYAAWRSGFCAWTATSTSPPPTATTSATHGEL